MLLSKLTIFWLLVSDIRFLRIKESLSNPTKTHYIRKMRPLPEKNVNFIAAFNCIILGMVTEPGCVTGKILV